VTKVGTTINFSPEIYKESGYSYKCDVWALGCILYELCSLKHPFSANHEGAIMYKILSEEPEEIPKEYSSQMRDLVKDLLKKDPDQRPKMEEVVKVVEKQKKENGAQQSIPENVKDLSPMKYGIPPQKWSWIYATQELASNWQVNEDPSKYLWSAMEPGCSNHLEGYFTTNRTLPVHVNMSGIQYRIDLQDLDNMYGYIL
jgi:serine/threonine protein kinase